MKAKQYQSRLQQQLTSNYNICQMIVQREGVRAGLPLLTYQQIMYLLLNGRIPISKIGYFKNKKYDNQQPIVGKALVIQDAVELSMEVIQKAWRFEKSSEKMVKHEQKSKKKKEKQKKSHQSTMNIREITKTGEDEQQSPENDENDEKEQKQQKAQSQRKNKSADKRGESKMIQKSPNKYKIEQLKQTLTMLQGKINCSRNQQQIFEYQKQYNRYFKEYQHLRNEKRINKQRMILKKIQHQGANNSLEKLQHLLEEMNKIKNINSKILDKRTNFQQKIGRTQEINRISAIFNHYAKKQKGILQRCFSDLEQEINHLNLQTFLKFVQDWRLNRILTLDKITNIFKIRSKGRKSVNILQFTQILHDIHAHECIEEEKALTNESSSQYMQEYIVNEQKMNKILLNRDKKHQSIKKLPEQAELRNKIISNYKFKPKSIAGKYIHDIREELLSKKKSIDFLASSKNIVKYQNRNSMNLRNNTEESSKIQMGTIQTNFYNPTISVKDSINNSYAFQFKLKKNKKRYKTEDILQTEIKNLQPNTTINDENRENIQSRAESKIINIQTQMGSIKNKNQHSLQLKKKIDGEVGRENIKGGRDKTKIKQQGLGELIDESQEDEYLRKFILPPIRQKKSFTYVHY